MNGTDNKPRVNTIEYVDYNGMGEKVTIQWDASFEDYMEAFTTIMLHATWQPETIAEGMKEFSEELKERFNIEGEEEPEDECELGKDLEEPEELNKRVDVKSEERVHWKKNEYGRPVKEDF